MRRSDSEQLAASPSPAARRLPKLESVLRSEVASIIEREIEFPKNTLLTITSVKVLPDLSQARIGVSVLPMIQTKQAFKVLITSAHEVQRLVNQRMRLYRVPKLNFYLDDSLAEADRIESLLDNLKAE